jgi:putative ABC transport system permease protein
MWKLIRFRGLQAAAIALLSALITACVVFAPLYDRATQQALVDLRLTQSAVQFSGLTIEGSWPSVQVPESTLKQFAAPVRSFRGLAAVVRGEPTRPTGTMVWRDGFCGHVEVVAGRCPDEAGQIMVSVQDAKIFGYQPSGRLTISGERPPGAISAPEVVTTVAGVYRQVESDYWFGLRLTGRSGLPDPEDPPRPQHDAWLTDASTFTDPDSILPRTVSAVDFALDQPATGVDELLQMGPVLRNLERVAPTSDAVAFTRLPEIADEVTAQRAQSRVTIPLLMVQLGLLAAVVFWLVLSAATEQRRPEVALALLRGRGRRGARRLVLHELLPVVLLGVPLGSGIALLLCWVTVAVFLPGSAAVEIRPAPVLALAGITLGLAGLTALAGWRVTREPVESLLRAVQSRRTGWRLGALETLILTASGTAVVAFVTGGLTGPIALAAPSLLALVVGLLLANATVPAATASGRGLLRRGLLTAGVSAVGAARSPATRRMLAILTVATALLVFCVDALVIGERNRARAAEQQAGAALVTEIYGNDLSAVRRVVAEVDPRGRLLTPVVAVRAPAPDSPTTLAVVPEEFERIALFPGQSPSAIPWRKLAPPSVPAIRIQGSRITGHLTTTGMRIRGNDPDFPPTLALQVVGPTNRTVRVSLGTIPIGAGRLKFVAPARCKQGCVLSGLTIVKLPGSEIAGTLTLNDVRADRKPVRIGPGSTWESVTDTEIGSVVVRSAGDGITMDLDAGGGNALMVNHGWSPSVVPAITTGPLPAGGDGNAFLAQGIDGLNRDATRVASLPRVPASGPQTAIMNLDVLQRGVAVNAESRIMLWFAHDDPATLAKVRRALSARGVRIATSTSLTDRRRGYDETTTAWSLQLAGAVGAVSLLIAILVLLVIAATTWRLRSRDLAALRMTGVSRGAVRRIAVAEHVTAVLLAGLAGALCGVVGAHFALPTIPLFATAPEVSTLDLGTAWIAVGAATASAVVLLIVVGWVSGEAIARRAVLDRVRESL